MSTGGRRDVERYRLYKPGLCLLLAVALWALSAPGVHAQRSALTDQAAIDLLIYYRIIVGNESGDLLLNRGLTRAEAATVFVRAIGLEGMVADFADALVFEDTEEHWARGYLHLVFRAGLMRGYADGTFRPDQPITYAEALTVILRIIGQEPTQGTWPENVLQRADALGIAPQAFDLRDLAYAPAQRGRIFPSLGKALNTPDLGGVTALQRYLDRKPPTLTVRGLPGMTAEQTVTFSGTVGEPVTLTVNGRPVDVDEQGSFRATLVLNEGINHVVVRAVDQAGNEALFAETVVRRVDAARFAVEGPSAVQIGQSAQYRLAIFDSQGRQLPGDLLRVQVQGNLATWDAATSTLTAGNRPGTGALILRAGDNLHTFEFRVTGASPVAAGLRIGMAEGGPNVAPNRTVRMLVQVLDQDGLVIDADSGRQIAVTISGADQSTLKMENDGRTVNGIVTFSFTSPAFTGEVLVSASSSSLTAPEYKVTVGTTVRVVLVASPRTIIADGTSTSAISAALRDQDGKEAINPTGAPITVLLRHEGAGTLDETLYLTIPPNAAISSNSITLASGTTEGAAHISGRVISTPGFPVDATSVVLLQSGAANLPSGPTRLELQVSSTTVTPSSTSPITLTVRVLDALGRVVSAGNYGFQVMVTTSNQEEVVKGLPTGVTLKLGNTTYTPVDDGYPANDPRHDTTYVVGRTHSGTAQIKLTYGRSGLVNVLLRPAPFTQDAVRDNGSVGPAISTLNMSMGSVLLTYVGTPTAIQLTADSAAFGTDKSVAAMPARSDSSVTLRARLLDATGAVVPNNTTIMILGRSGPGVTTFPVSSARFVNGVATFQVNGTSASGTDTYTATSGMISSNSLSVSTRTSPPDAPVILAISGGSESVVREANIVSPDDTHMRIELAPQPVQSFVVARVYRSPNQLIHTTDPIDVSSGTVLILVPRQGLSFGTNTYQVTFNNGAGESARSANSFPVASVRYDTTITVTSASYNASTRKLTIQGTNIVAGTGGGSVDTARFTLEKGALTLSLAGADVTVGTNTITLDLAGLPDVVSALETPSVWNGSVNLRAAEHWYRRTTVGVVAPPDTTGNPVTPMVNVTQALLDLENRRLTLIGSGFSGLGVSLNPTKLLIRDVSGPTSVRLLSADTGSAQGDTRFVINLSTTTANSLQTLDGTVNELVTEEGWSRDNRTGLGPPLDSTPRVYNAATLTRATYDAGRKVLTLIGSGFANSMVDVTKLAFHKPGSPATSHQLTGADGSVTVTGTTITFRLLAADADEVAANFMGSAISLRADELWLVDNKSRPAAPLPPGQIHPHR
jgi:hypothetical protein